MRMFNADGSEAEMCGNGVRCVAKYVYDHGICRKTDLRIETGRGVLTLDLEVAGGLVRAGAGRHGRADPRTGRIPVECRRRRLTESSIFRPTSSPAVAAGELDGRLRAGTCA